MDCFLGTCVSDMSYLSGQIVPGLGNFQQMGKIILAQYEWNDLGPCVDP